MSENEVSCYSTRVLLEYAREKKLTRFMEHVTVPETVLEDPHQWTTAETWSQLARNIEIELGNKPDTLIHVTREIMSKQSKGLFPLLLRILPPHTFINSVTSFTRNYSNKNLLITVQPDGKNRWSYIVKRATPGFFSPQMCDFNRGAAFAFYSMKGYTDIVITEHTCIPRHNAESCTYTIEGIPPRSLYQKLKNRFFLLLSNQKDIINHLEENQKILQQQNRELLAIRDFYSHIMTNMNEAIVWLDSDGIITFANNAFVNITGIANNNITGYRFKKYLADEFTASHFTLLCNDARQKPSTPVETEFSFSSENSTVRIGATTILWIAGEHYSPGFLISIRDITDKRTMERQLSAAEDRYRSLYENSPALIIALDLTGHFLYSNPAMTEQSGYTEEELRTMHFRDLIAPNAEFSVDHFLRNLLTESDQLQEVHFKTKDNEWKCIALHTYHIYDNEEAIAGVAGIGIDLTETKRLNEQLIRTQRMDILGQLAGGLAHDFGNVITSINGFAKLIREKSNDDKIVHFGETIERAGMRAIDLVKSLLAFSSNDSTQNKDFDVISIVDEVREILTGAVPYNISIQSELPDYPLIINGDPGKIHQCILNLCINARDAIGDHKGHITLRALRVFSNGEKIHIQVEDDGSGIPPDIIEKIYDPFFSTKKKKSGTGLGLSVVYGIIKSHNGDIIVDSHPGEGTLFTLELPSRPNE